MKSRSRLSYQQEKKSEKSLVMSVLGIIIVLIVVIKFGLPFFVNTMLVGNTNNDSQDTTTQTATASFIAPPLINPLPNATNSAQVKITGTATGKYNINLYINDELVDKTATNNDNSFSFDSVTLSSGQNTIKVKAVNKDDSQKQSNYSDSLIVEYKKDTPKLTVDTPSDGQPYVKDNNTASVTGTTDPSNKVTVNDFWAIVDETGKYSYSLPLKSGDNEIKVVATDDAGNKTEIDKKVTYSP